MQLEPHKVVIPNEIWRRLQPHDGLFKAAVQFVKCCETGAPIPRKCKASGYANDGSIFDPYVRLGIHHHHLHRSPDPLLVTQHIANENIIVGIALTKHVTYFGDKMAWLQDHAQMIDWSSCEDIEGQALSYQRPLEPAGS
jgi:hypothetical protein